jgi:hypothetical protein
LRNGAQVYPFRPAAAAQAAGPVERRAGGCRGAEHSFNGAPAVSVESVEKLLRRGKELMLLGAEQAVAAFAGIEKAELATALALQVEDHAGQAAGEAAESRLAIVDHVQRRPMIGAVARFAHFPLDRRHQALQSVARDDVVGPGAHGAYGSFFVGRLGDDDQRQVDLLAVEDFQHALGGESGQAMDIKHGVPALTA